MSFPITATHVNYYRFCKRQLWLSLNYINMEQYNENVSIGKIIECNSFKRRSKNKKQVQLGNIKIDFIDIKNKMLYETKKSSKNKDSAIWQMKYYLYTIGGSYKGVVEIPTERKKINVELCSDDIKEIEEIIENIKKIKDDNCPGVINNKKCKKCSFFEFCYS